MKTVIAKVASKLIDLAILFGWVLGLFLIAYLVSGCATPAGELRTKFDECHANGFDAVVTTNFWHPGSYRFAGCRPRNPVTITESGWQS